MSACLLTAGVARSVSASPGQLDDGFGDRGVVITSYGERFTAPQARFVDGFVQPDGRSLAGGNVTGLTGEEANVGETFVYRYRTDGTLDPTFSGDGLSPNTLGPGSESRIEDMTPSSRGGVFVAGSYRDPETGFARWGVIEIDAQGHRSSGFGVGYGYARLFLDGYASYVYELPNHFILVGGSVIEDGNSSGRLYRLTPDGLLDWGFGGPGLEGVRLPTAVSGILADEQGRILVSSGALFRLHPDGTLDTTFGEEGRFAGEGAGVIKAIQPNGMILALGARPIRITPDGTGSGPVGSVPFRPLDISPDDQGRIVAVGKACSDPYCQEHETFVARRYQSDGSPDLSFGTGGVVESDLGYRAYGTVVSIDDAGRIVVMGPHSNGYGDAQVMLVRLAGGGTQQVARADIRVAQSEIRDPVRVGEEIEYRIVVRDDGPTPATGIVLVDSIPDGTELISLVSRQETDPSCRHYAGSSYRCYIGQVWDTATYVLKVRAIAEGTLRNDVAVLGDLPDPDASNNVSTETTVVWPACTLVGTDGDDNLVGTPGRDVICGGDGDDVIDGKAGDDVIYGEGGADVIKAGGGGDEVLGGDGDDTIDAIDGVSGNDVVEGGAGSNLCPHDPGEQPTNCKGRIAGLLARLPA
jgi:uncharacterized repeat protein (TIGR01451 family)/uncharacterized delta-60 repeat protein